MMKGICILMCFVKSTLVSEYSHRIGEVLKVVNVEIVMKVAFSDKVELFTAFLAFNDLDPLVEKEGKIEKEKAGPSASIQHTDAWHDKYPTFPFT
ncbi:hypothetical protein RJT34_22872 [Clitoria ternatea]|uniref:Uncharacterized protein n=1 Tax=Clitoria ternatea TaxID=43366 RepID=A0AAN9IEF1_CLITE